MRPQVEDQRDVKAFTALFTTLFISAVGPRGSVSLSLRETCCWSRLPCASDHPHNASCGYRTTNHRTLPPSSTDSVLRRRERAEMTLLLAVIDSPGSEHSERTTGVLSVFAYESRTRAGKPVIPSSLPPPAPLQDLPSLTAQRGASVGGGGGEEGRNNWSTVVLRRLTQDIYTSAAAQTSCSRVNFTFHIPNVIKNICNADVSQETPRRYPDSPTPPW